jgi:hypothetical protein
MRDVNTIYIKPMVWVGKTEFFVGYEPSNPSADRCFRLGGYIYVTDDIERARSYARATGRTIVECDSFVGL